MADLRVRLAEGLELDLGNMVHGLVTASSGGGKSSLLRLVLERTHGRIPHLVFDDEGEFVTLRDRFDYVIAGRGRDVALDPRTVRLLVRRQMEHGFSAILDLSELPDREREEIVREALEELLLLPRNLWRPLLVVLDETQRYARQRERRGRPAVARDAVADFSSRARKRGWKALYASQRIAKVDKDAVGECNARLVGGQNLQDDRAEAAEWLGDRSKEMLARLGGLEPGEYLCVGRPFGLRQVSRVRMDRPLTSPPPSGAGGAAPSPPARATMAKVLEQLRDLPRQAEEDARSREALEAEVALLREHLEVARAAASEAAPVVERVPFVPPEALEALSRAKEVAGNQLGRLEQALDGVRVVREALREAEGVLLGVGLVADRPEAVGVPSASEAEGEARAEALGRAMAREAFAASKARLPAAAADGKLGGPHRAILEALARLHAHVGVARPTNAQVAAWAGYSKNGGAFNNPLGTLRSLGLVDKTGDGTLALTPEGRKAAGSPPPLSRRQLQEQVLGMLAGPEAAILRTCIAAYPGALSREEVARRTVSPAKGTPYEPDGGAFNNPVGHLRTMGLIEYPRSGTVRAAPFLFPAAAVVGVRA